MKTLILLLFSLAFALHASAQELFVPDDEAIYKEVSSPGSKYYYPDLFIRYELGDSTLTIDDYRYLYYGYVWQDSYKPLDPIASEHSILVYMEQNRDMNFDTLSLLRILDLSSDVMKHDPFSLRNINIMTYAYQTLGDVKNAKLNAERFRKILAVIQTSGTGIKDSSPLHVLKQEHAIDVLDAMGLQTRKRTYITVRVEVFELFKEYMGKKAIYFDFGRAYRRPPSDAATGSRNSGLEINGIKVKSR